MKGFIQVTGADTGKALIPVDNIEYVTESNYNNSKSEITFKYSDGDTCLCVKESFEEIVAKIEAANTVKSSIYGG